MEGFVSAIAGRLAAYWTIFDWTGEGPWLAMLLLLVGGVGVPVGVYEIFDRWAARRLRVDTVALATRYGGFMNSWAVFGRHASEYRDVRPLFPGALAAELARFGDGTAVMAARFRNAADADTAAAQRFASFAAQGVEYAEAGLSFQLSGEKPGSYACGQWLVIGAMLFAFYGPDSAALKRRRQATPALRARRFPGPLRLLHSRWGHGLLISAWMGAAIIGAGQMLETAAQRRGEGGPVPEVVLRQRLAALAERGIPVVTWSEGDALMIAERPDDLRSKDFDILAGRNWLSGLRLRFDPGHNSVSALLLVGRSAPGQDGMAAALPDTWHNNALLFDPDDPLMMSVRDAIQSAGWTWRPRLWPDCSIDWRGAWSRLHW
ncbi:MAG TPA: hypothetical protein VF194_00660 [Ferrovibrio sp.]|uniref:hypothetical protein n=1 Tax=Ferrovibrio sp. TaxID=1917215 RepID=UPI002ED3A2C2